MRENKALINIRNYYLDFYNTNKPPKVIYFLLYFKYLEGFGHGENIEATSGKLDANLSEEILKLTQEDEKENSVPSKKVCIANIALRNSLSLTNDCIGRPKLGGKYIKDCHKSNKNITEADGEQDKDNNNDEYTLLDCRKRKPSTSNLSESFKKGTEIWPNLFFNSTIT